MAGEKSRPGESSRPEGLRPGGTVNTDAPEAADAGGATDSAGPALATPPPRPLSAASCCRCRCRCCCGGGGCPREPVSSCVKLPAPGAPEEAPSPPASASEGKSAEASVSGPGLASPAPVKSDSTAERGGSARCGRGGGRADMVDAPQGREKRERSLERETEKGFSSSSWFPALT